MSLRYGLLGCVALCALCLSGSAVWGQETGWRQETNISPQTVTVEQLWQRLQQNEAELQRLRQLVQQQLQQQRASDSVTQAGFEAPATETPKQPDVEVIDTHNQKFTVKVGGRLHFDTQYGSDDGLSALGIEEFENQTEIRRARILLEGEGYGIFDYKFEVGFADFNDPTAKDAYIGIQFPIGHVKIGHFKEPFSLNEMTSGKYTTFIERALPIAMVPSRNLGIMLSNTYDDKMGTWAVGTFLDDLADPGEDSDKDGDNDFQDSENRAITVRLTRLLFYEADGRYLLHIGGSFRHVESDDSLRFRARPEVHQDARLLGVVTAPTNSYQQYGIEAALVWGGFSLQSEWIVTDIAAAGDPWLQGGYVYASYFLTGEHRAYSRSSGAFSRVKPLENFWWVDSDNSACDFGWGAWEVAFRYSWLDYADDGLTSAGGGTNGIPGEMDGYTVGINWYWNPYMRLMFNYVHTDLNASAGPDADEDVFITRLQVDF